MIPIQELENMEPVVLRWIFGKPILRQLKSLHILVLFKDKPNVKVPNVAIIPIIVMTEFVRKMVVISILIEWELKNSTVEEKNSPLILNKK
jgi:hypothetical protein